jgi:hypothetical protein
LEAKSKIQKKSNFKEKAPILEAILMAAVTGNKVGSQDRPLIKQ